MWCAANAELRRKCVALSNTSKEERSQISDHSFYCKKLDEEEHVKPELKRRKEIIRSEQKSVKQRTDS